MKISIQKCATAHETITALNQVQDCRINATAGYWLGRLNDKLTPIAKSYYAQKNKLIERLGTLEKNGTHVIKSDSPNWQAYVDELDKLSSVDEEVEFKLMKFSLFEKESGTESLPPSFWTNVGSLFVESLTDDATSDTKK